MFGPRHVAPSTTVAHSDVNRGRHSNRPTKAWIVLVAPPPTSKVTIRFVNPRRQTKPLTEANVTLTPIFIDLRVRGIGLVKTRSVSEAMPHRETKSRRNAISHEDTNHKRVCIAGSNRNHRTFVCAGPYWQPTSHGCGGTRILAVGISSMWRCSEWNQWLWPPHGQARIPFAPEPQGDTV